MQKIDLKKTWRQLYKPSPLAPAIVEVPAFNFLCIEGENALPGNEDFQQAIEALFSVAYKIKFALKQTQLDFVVMPMEGLWWSDDMEAFVRGDKEKWKWQFMIMQPEAVSEAHLEAAKEVVRKKKALPQLDRLQLQRFEEGLSAQILHIGPFEEEHANIQRLHDLIKAEGGRFDGKQQRHHEIYLSDFRKVAPEKMRTVLRQPFVQA